MHMALTVSIHGYVILFSPPTPSARLYDVVPEEVKPDTTITAAPPVYDVVPSEVTEQAPATKYQKQSPAPHTPKQTTHQSLATADQVYVLCILRCSCLVLLLFCQT